MIDYANRWVTLEVTSTEEFPASWGKKVVFPALKGIQVNKLPKSKRRANCSLSSVRPLEHKMAIVLNTVVCIEYENLLFSCKDALDDFRVRREELGKYG